MGRAEYYATEGTGYPAVTDPYLEEVLALNAKLIAWCERLQEALRPFAEFTAVCFGYDDDLPLCTAEQHGQEGALTLADCRRAREALASTP